MTYKTRRILSILLLVLGLPAYIALAWWGLSLFDRPSLWVELGIYIVLGIAWAIPFRAVFKGVGQADPDAQTRD